MKKYITYFMKGLLTFFLIDILSSYVTLLIWNTFIYNSDIPKLQFIQCLGAILIWDFFSIVNVYRKDYSKSLDKKD